MAASSSTAIALASARTSLSPLSLSNLSLSLLKTNHNSSFLRKSFKIHGGKLSIRAMCSDSSSASFGSRLEDSVKKIVTDNSVVIYSKSWCSYSSEVKSLFKRLGVQPMVIELDQLGPQGPQLQKVLERLTGQHTVPNVFIGGKHIGGCTDTLKLHRQGDLQPMLSEASSKNS